ncbi:MAG: ackA 2 [Thermomicrobiales bacterium]|nr:ackA 2 [Thermomicrobiales bacterium]
MNPDGQILVLNAGSSSLKLGLFDAMSDEQLAERQMSWDVDAAPGYQAALRHVMSDIDVSRVTAVGHRVVHGGARFTAGVLLDTTIQAEIAELTSLAPLHNGPALAVIDEVARMLPGVPQVAAFDTAFHATLPPHAYLYALPYEWHERWGVRRFGFHGLSHAYCAARAAELLGLPLAQLKLVTCHLGSGCSLAAVAGGRSIATTMGFTPLDGLVMATRPGAVDPGVLTYLLAENRLTLPELEEALYHQSGLKGVSGCSGDMRQVLAARAASESRAALAFDLYVERLREGIGAMVAALAGIDGLVFTGGVGEHTPEVRAAACDAFAWAGLTLDDAGNANATPDAVISTPDSGIRVVVLHTREELMVARETVRVLRAS